MFEKSDHKIAALREKVEDIVARALGERYERRQLRLELMSLKMLEPIVRSRTSSALISLKTPL